MARRERFIKVRTDEVIPGGDSLSAGTGATRVWVVATRPVTTESGVKDKPLGRKEGIDISGIGQQINDGSGPGIWIGAARGNIRRDGSALKAPYPKAVSVPLESKYAPAGIDKAFTEGATARIEDGTTGIT